MRPTGHKRFGVLRVFVLGSTLALVAFYIGYVIAGRVPVNLMAGLLKYAIGAVGIVWLFSLNVYNKLSDATDMPGLDYHQHRELEVVVSVRLQWFWLRAFYLAILGLLLALPSVINDAKLLIPQWVFGLSSAALALALFSLRGIWSELEDIRHLRSHIKEVERMEKERAELLKTTKEGLAEGWAADPNLDGFRGGHADAKQ